MKNTGFSLLLAALFAATTASADLTITQKVEGMGQVSDMTMKIKGDLIRVDPNAEMTSIINNTSGEMMTIMHGQKVYMTISGDQTKAMLEASKNAAGGGDEKATTPELKATGEKEKVTIDGKEYDTEKYTFEMGTVKGTYWIAKDFPNGDKVMEQMKALYKGPLGQSLSAGTPDIDKLPGLPIKTLIEMEGQDPVTTTIVSVKEEAIADDQFKAPAGYNKMDMPGGQ